MAIVTLVFVEYLIFSVVCATVGLIGVLSLGLVKPYWVLNQRMKMEKVLITTRNGYIRTVIVRGKIFTAIRDVFLDLSYVKSEEKFMITILGVHIRYIGISNRQFEGDEASAVYWIRIADIPKLMKALNNHKKFKQHGK